MSYLSSATTQNNTTSCTSDWRWTDFNADGTTDWVCSEKSGNQGKVFILLSDGTSLHAPAGAYQDGTLGRAPSPAAVQPHLG